MNIERETPAFRKVSLELVTIGEILALKEICKEFMLQHNAENTLSENLAHQINRFLMDIAS